MLSNAQEIARNFNTCYLPRLLEFSGSLYWGSGYMSRYLSRGIEQDQEEEEEEEEEEELHIV
jgi:hypothetical protein